VSEFTNIVIIRAKAGKTDALGQALRELIVPTRREKQCAAYDLHQSGEDKDVWMVYERWRSKEGVEAHLAEPYVQAFVARLGDLVAVDIAIDTYAYVTP
jgi:quinol monooxygenase YgiN